MAMSLSLLVLMGTACSNNSNGNNNNRPAVTNTTTNSTTLTSPPAGTSLTQLVGSADPTATIQSFLSPYIQNATSGAIGSVSATTGISFWGKVSFSNTGVGGYPQALNTNPAPYMWLRITDSNALAGQAAPMNYQTGAYAQGTYTPNGGAYGGLVSIHFTDGAGNIVTIEGTVGPGTCATSQFSGSVTLTPGSTGISMNVGSFTMLTANFLTCG